MVKEKEIWTEITKEEFDSYLSHLTSVLGEPEVKRRLALQSTDSSRTDLDTRVRITNGQAVIMQKIGDWDAETRDELEIDIDSTPDSVLGTYKAFRNMITGKSISTSIMQMENYTFSNKQFEIKLTKQTGKEVAYNYEIEVFDDSNPSDIAKEYSMRVDIPTHTPEFWDAWNERVNLNTDDLDEKELKKIVERYL